MQAVLWEEMSEVGRPVPLGSVPAECNVALTKMVERVVKGKRHEVPFTGCSQADLGPGEKDDTKTWHLAKRVLIAQRGAQKGKRKRWVVSGQEACLVWAKHPGTSGW